jgi:Helix-turn-helix domain
MSDHQRLLFRVEEVLQDHLPIGRSKFYDEVRAGRLAVVRIGRRTFVTAEELNRYVRELSEEAVR